MFSTEISNLTKMTFSNSVFSTKISGLTKNGFSNSMSLAQSYY